MRASSTPCAASTRIAAPFIGVAMVLDTLDGRIARHDRYHQRVRAAVRFAGRRDLVRHRAGDLDVLVGADLARQLGMGGGVRLRDGGGDAARAFQHSGRIGRQTIFRRHAEPGSGNRAGVDDICVSVGIPGADRRHSGARARARAGISDGEHRSSSAASRRSICRRAAPTRCCWPSRC